MALERSHESRVAFCQLYRQASDRCIVVLSETNLAGPAMVRWRGWTPIGRPLEVLAPDPRARARFFSTVATSYKLVHLELFVNEIPPALNGGDFALFRTSLVRRMNAYHSRLP